jgi:hypothetical protein
MPRNKGINEMRQQSSQENPNSVMQEPQQIAPDVPQIQEVRGGSRPRFPNVQLREFVR